MKKKSILLLLVTMLLIGCSSPATQVNVEESKGKELAFLQNFGKEVTDVPFEKKEVKAKFPEYKVEKNLSNVANGDVIIDFSALSEKEIDQLVKNKFFVRGDTIGYEQPFTVYEINEYFYLSNFVTTDSMIHLYHIFYDNLLRDLEEQQFLPKLGELTKNMAVLAEDDYESAQNEVLKEATLKNYAFYVTGAKLLNVQLDLNIPDEVLGIVEKEMASIERQEIEISQITDKLVDYSQFKPRGHYTRSEDLERYFKATMWYSQEKFYPYINGKPADKHVLSALLMTKNLYSDEEIYSKYDNIVKPLNFLVENTEDINVDNLAPIYFSVYGKDSSIEDLLNEESLQQVYQEIDKFEIPEINPKEGLNFAFMPQRAVSDTKWMQKLLDTKNEPSLRPIYSGMDLMAVLGSELAKEYQLDQEDNKHWEDYPKALEATTKDVSNLEDSYWQKNLYRGWLWTIQEYTHEYPEGYPDFMRTKEWQWKDLNSGLGSWSELKHDTVLYGKQASAEMGGGMKGKIKHFVEPNVGLYEKLGWLLEFSKVNLKDRQLLTEDQEKGFDNFISLNNFLLECSIKELENQELSDKDQERLGYIGGEMENIFISFVDPTAEYFNAIEEAADRNMAIIADVMRVGPNGIGKPEGKYLEVGVSGAQEIFVAYPVGNEIYIGRGAVFDYYEFLSDTRMTDEEWRDIRMDSSKISRPDWTKSYVIKQPEYFFDEEHQGWVQQED